MGQPVQFLTVNGTKLQNQGRVPLSEDMRTSAQQFWTERLQAMKRYLDSGQTSSTDTGGRPAAEDDG
jgi:hypothetical protein